MTNNSVSSKDSPVENSLGLKISYTPDSSDKTHTDYISKIFGTLAISPNLVIPDQLYIPSSDLNLTSHGSNATSEIDLSSSASSIRSKQPKNFSDIDEFFSLRTKNPNNPLIGFLNINSLRNKITDLRLVMERCLPDLLVIQETKLTSDFKTESFVVNNYQSQFDMIGMNLGED